MGKRKVVILDVAVTRVAEIAMFIEGEGLPKTAKKFVDDALSFSKLCPMREPLIILADIYCGRL